MSISRTCAESRRKALRCLRSLWVRHATPAMGKKSSNPATSATASKRIKALKAQQAKENGGVSPPSPSPPVSHRRVPPASVARRSGPMKKTHRVADQLLHDARMALVQVRAARCRCAPKTLRKAPAATAAVADV